MQCCDGVEANYAVKNSGRGGFPRGGNLCAARGLMILVLLLIARTEINFGVGEDKSCCFANCECARDADEAEELEVCGTDL